MLALLNAVSFVRSVGKGVANNGQFRKIDNTKSRVLSGALTRSVFSTHLHTLTFRPMSTDVELHVPHQTTSRVNTLEPNYTVGHSR